METPHEDEELEQGDAQQSQEARIETNIGTADGDEVAELHPPVTPIVGETQGDEVLTELKRVKDGTQRN